MSASPRSPTSTSPPMSSMSSFHSVGPMTTISPAALAGRPEDVAQLDPAVLAAIPGGVAFDMKRLKVYSSCLRCRAKKVKCDRKEPCARCVKHNVECSYRELASVQLDIRQFQRHLNNPKIRKDGAGFITSTATPILAGSLLNAATAANGLAVASSTSASSRDAFSVSFQPNNSTTNSNSNAATSPSSPTSPSTDTTTDPLVKVLTALSTMNRESSSTSMRKKSSKHRSSPQSSHHSTADNTDTESDTSSPHQKQTSSSTSSRQPSGKALAMMARAKVHKISRKPKTSKPKISYSSDVDMEDAEHQSMTVHTQHDTMMEEDTHLRHRQNRRRQHHLLQAQQEQEEEEEDDYGMDQVLVRQDDDDEDSGQDSDEQQDVEANVESLPIWRAKAVGRHKHTPQEQDLADTFGLAAYLKAKEMAMDQDRPVAASAAASLVIDYELELERALAQRMPSSFSRPERSQARAQKYAAYLAANAAAAAAVPVVHASLPSSRPNNCQGAGHQSGDHYQAEPVATQCCCQIAAKQGQAPGTCFLNSAAAADRFVGHQPEQQQQQQQQQHPQLHQQLHQQQQHQQQQHFQPSQLQHQPHTMSMSLSPPPLDGEQTTTRIAYSPSYSPTYTPIESSYNHHHSDHHKLQGPHQERHHQWSNDQDGFCSKPSSSSSIKIENQPQSMSFPYRYLPELPNSLSGLTASSSSLSSYTNTSYSHQRKVTLTPAELSVIQDGSNSQTILPVSLECKYNEPNVDAWDMIEKPISRTVPVTTKRGRSVKMEMGWILS